MGLKLVDLGPKKMMEEMAGKKKSEKLTISLTWSLESVGHLIRNASSTLREAQLATDGERQATAAAAREAAR